MAVETGVLTEGSVDHSAHACPGYDEIKKNTNIRVRRQEKGIVRYSAFIIILS